MWLLTHINVLKKRQNIYPFTVTSLQLFWILVESVSWKEMDPVTWIQILDDDVCILHSANTFQKGMNSIVLPPAVGYRRADWHFSIGMATNLEEIKI